MLSSPSVHLAGATIILHQRAQQPAHSRKINPQHNRTTITATMSANAREQKTIATTNTDGMVVFSLQDLNADVLGQVAGSSRAGSGAAGEKEKVPLPAEQQ